MRPSHWVDPSSARSRPINAARRWKDPRAGNTASRASARTNDFTADFMSDSERHPYLSTNRTAFRSFSPLLPGRLLYWLGMLSAMAAPVVVVDFRRECGG